MLWYRCGMRRETASLISGRGDPLFPPGELDEGPVDEDREVAPELIRVPWRIELDGEWLVWHELDRERFDAAPYLPKSTTEARDKSRMDELGLWHFVRPHRRTLDGFLKLAEMPTAEAVLSFARRNGVLELCEHRLPACHDAGPLRFSHRRLPKCWPVDWQPGATVGRERVADWIRFAQWARAALNIAGHLRAKRPGRIEDWETLPEGITMLRGFGAIAEDWEKEPSQDHGPRFVHPSTGLGKDRELGATRLRQFVTAWLRVAQFAPRLRSSHRDHGKDFIRYGTSLEWGALFAVLGFQMASRIARGEIAPRCDQCGENYDGERAPSGDRKILCKKCRLPAREKYRDLQRRAMKMHSDGVRVREIAKKLERPEDTVRGWINRGRVR